MEDEVCKLVALNCAIFVDINGCKAANSQRGDVAVASATTGQLRHKIGTRQTSAAKIDRDGHGPESNSFCTTIDASLALIICREC